MIREAMFLVVLLAAYGLPWHHEWALRLIEPIAVLLACVYCWWVLLWASMDLNLPRPYLPWGPTFRWRLEERAHRATLRSIVELERAEGIEESATQDEVATWRL